VSASGGAEESELELTQVIRDVGRLLNVSHGLFEIAGLENVVGEEGEHPSAPGPVAERLGLFQDADEAAKLGETEQGVSQVEPDIDGLLVPRATGGKWSMALSA
jgi:hypothetical protein